MPSRSLSPLIPLAGEAFCPEHGWTVFYRVLFRRVVCAYCASKPGTVMSIRPVGHDPADEAQGVQPR